MIMDWIALVAILISISVSYTVGTLLLWIARVNSSEESFYDVFLRLLLGVFFTTAVYAVVKTSCNTILLGVFLVGALFLFQKRKEWAYIRLSEYFQRKHIVNVLVPIGISFGFYAFYRIISYGEPFNILHFDDVYYSFLSTKIGVYGVESTNPLYEWNFLSNATPYHYAELWLVNMIVTVFGTNPLFTHSIIVKSMLSAVLVIGMFALTRQFTKNKFMLIFALFAITIAPMLLDYTDIRQMQTNTNNLKELICSPIYVWVVILIYRKSSFWYYPLLLLPALNLGAMPVLFSAAATYFVIVLFKEKSWKNFFLRLTPFLLMAVFVVMFYSLQTTDAGTSNGLSIDYIVGLYSFGGFAEHLYSNLVNYAMYALYLMPICILIVFLLIRNREKLSNLYLTNKHLLWFYVVSAIYGLIYLYLFYPLLRQDAGQLHNITNILLFNIIVFVTFLIVETYISSKWIKPIMYLYFSMMLIYSTSIFFISRMNMIKISEPRQSREYVNDVVDYYLTNGYGTNGAYLDKDLTVFSLDVNNENQCFSPFAVRCDFMYFNSMNTYFESDDSLQAYICNKLYDDSNLMKFWQAKMPECLSKDPFAVFCKEYVRNNGQTEIDTLRYEFVKFHSVEYMVLKNNAELSDIFMPIVDTVFIDSKTGDRFVFLKK